MNASATPAGVLRAVVLVVAAAGCVGEEPIFPELGDRAGDAGRDGADSEAEAGPGQTDGDMPGQMDGDTRHEDGADRGGDSSAETAVLQERAEVVPDADADREEGGAAREDAAVLPSSRSSPARDGSDEGPDELRDDGGHPRDGDATQDEADARAVTGDDGGREDASEGGNDAASSCDPSQRFTSIEAVLELNAATDDEAARLTADQLSVYFSRREGGGPFQIFSATRESVAVPFRTPTPLLLLPDSSGPAITADGSLLYYSSDRGVGVPDLYVATRPFSAGTTVALGELNSTAWDYSPYVSADNLELYFVSNRPDSIDDVIFVAPRADGRFVSPIAVGAVNSTSIERSPVVSADGLRLYFGSDRPLGAGSFDIYVAARARRSESFGAPVAVPELNTSFDELPDWISADGCTLYFRSSRPGGQGGRDIWRASRR